MSTSLHRKPAAQINFFYQPRQWVSGSKRIDLGQNGLFINSINGLAFTRYLDVIALACFSGGKELIKKPNKEKPNKEAPAVTLRVIAIRTLMHGDSQTAFARWLGIEKSRWNNLENGFPISRDIATLLVSRIEGLSVDWLWFGFTGNMSKPLLRQLETQIVICRRGIS